MSNKKVVLILTAVFVCACAVFAQESTSTQSEKTIKHVPIKNTSPVSGADMFRSYCAVCHGTDGKGSGPAASALKVPPTDLTQLTKSNGGKYPAMKVSSSIRGESAFPAHGSKDMPIWGTLFRNLSNGHEGEVQQRVVNLNKYIESIQAK